MERPKNDRAKGRLGEKIEEVLLVLAAFKTLDQFDVFPQNAPTLLPIGDSRHCKTKDNEKEP
jgi:hypothetical protein